MSDYTFLARGRNGKPLIHTVFVEPTDAEVYELVDRYGHPQITVLEARSILRRERGAKVHYCRECGSDYDDKFSALECCAGTPMERNSRTEREEEV